MKKPPPTTGLRFMDAVQRAAQEAAVLQALSDVAIDLFVNVDGRPPQMAITNRDSGTVEIARLDVVLTVAESLRARAEDARRRTKALLEGDISKLRLPPPSPDDMPPPGPPDVAVQNRGGADPRSKKHEAEHQGAPR
jgi:hypothetical protein